jgi:hypothetical protein
VSQPRAADDFDAIRARLKELRQEAEAPKAAEKAAPRHAETGLPDRDRRLRERREGHPPSWVPTIFFRSATDKAIACRIWRLRTALLRHK